ncbi:MAG: hypothetical protein PW734_07230 [Verrucomicrobium sp.]|nr:hypothetical protein [Verrucomicrobium sp.]
MRTALLLWCLLAWRAGAEEAVTFTDLTWHDAARDRDVPVRIYAPGSQAGPLPVLFFSHGLGGSREGYAYLGRYWAAHGYLSVHVQHLGSDAALLHSPLELKAAMANPKNYIDRPRDISFAIDQVAALNAAPGPWQGRFDLSRIGAAGHSFGAYTTMALAGETFASHRNPALDHVADPRVKAVVAMSLPHIDGQQFSGIHQPAFHFTGTEDRGRLREEDPKDRRAVFDGSSGPDTYLAVFQGGDHMVFSGRPRLMRQGGKGDHDADFQRLVCEGTTAFWDAYLKADARAKQWLAGGGFTQALGSLGAFEQK